MLWSELLTALGSAVVLLALRLLVILGFVWLVLRTINAVIGRLTRRLERPEVDPARRARLTTVLATAGHTTRFIILFIALLMVLNIVGLNIGPVLAGVGVAGLAVSLGAQALIRDFIGGFLILIEDQYHVGDVIQVGTTSGTVEQITLRASYLRDLQGRLWVIPNGDVRTVSNQTRGWSQAVVEVNVAFDADIGQVVQSLEAAMERVPEDPALAGALLAAPQVHGWSNFTDWSVQVRMTVRTLPGKQWDAAQVMRREALAALQQAGIRVVAH